jgi:hypothetical protein
MSDCTRWLNNADHKTKGGHFPYCQVGDGKRVKRFNFLAWAGHRLPLPCLQRSAAKFQEITPAGVSPMRNLPKHLTTMNIANHVTIAIVCCAWLASPVADAGEEMSREPGPGEKIEPTKIGDDKTTQLLVGTWMHEEKIGDDYEVKQTYAFEKDGSYQMNSVKRIRKEKIESNVKGQWTVRDGILTLTPTDPKGEANSLYGRFTAYTILKISDTTFEWQVNWGRSDTSPAVKRTLTITTHKRVK